MNGVFNNPANISESVNITKQVGEKQSQIEQITFEHFLFFKELCGEEREEELRKMISDFADKARRRDRERNR